MNKKGISPLISTVVLLLFAIILGLIVMNWGKGQVEAASKCPADAGLKIVELNNIPEICYAGTGENGYIHFIVENGPRLDIGGIQMTVIGTKKVYNVNIKKPVKMAHSILRDIPHDFNEFGDIRQVKIYPKISISPGEDPVLCTDQAIVLDKIRSC